MAKESKLTDKLKEGKHRGRLLIDVIEEDVKHVKELISDYGLVLENCAYAFYQFHLDRVNDVEADIMY